MRTMALAMALLPTVLLAQEKGPVAEQQPAFRPRVTMEGVTGPWNDGYIHQISKIADDFAKEYGYKRVRDDFAPDCFIPHEWNWTEDEAKLYRAMSDRKTQPCFTDFTKRMLNEGCCWLPGTLQWTYDWRLIEEPEGLTEKWDGVFWSLVRKQREKHWLKFQYYSYLEDRKLDNAAVLVSEFVDNQTAQKVKAENIEDRRDAKRQQFIEERMTTHQAVEDWLKDKPGMTPGKAMDDALPAGPVERFPADAPQALLTPRQ